jgi:hypothetical protein
MGRTRVKLGSRGWTSGGMGDGGEGHRLHTIPSLSDISSFLLGGLILWDLRTVHR